LKRREEKEEKNKRKDPKTIEKKNRKKFWAYGRTGT
jgi:hypothetical protein